MNNEHIDRSTELHILLFFIRSVSISIWKLVIFINTSDQSWEKSIYQVENRCFSSTFVDSVAALVAVTSAVTSILSDQLRELLGVGRIIPGSGGDTEKGSRWIRLNESFLCLFPANRFNPLEGSTVSNGVFVSVKAFSARSEPSQRRVRKGSPLGRLDLHGSEGRHIPTASCLKT